MILAFPFLLVLASILNTAHFKEHPEAKLPFMDYCRYFGYPAQYHDVTTEDGYILRVFRIQRKGTQIQDGLKPILLQHGLLDSSDTWLINDEDKAPGFMLANAGYDVWLGNNRGNKYSRKHVKLNPNKDKQFWQFTFQHMADFDVPTLLSYIHNSTTQKVSYIGHSQGTLQMHIALAKNNLIVERVLDKYFAFGPVAYVEYLNSELIGMLNKTPILQWFKAFHIYEFFPGSNWFETETGVLFCSEFPQICGDSMKYLCDADPQLDNYERYDVLVGHNPSGTSVMNMAHWKQLLKNKSFEAFDYGSKKKNIQEYSQEYPPSWDLKKIRKPVRLFVGDSDQCADETDVKHLWSLIDPQYRAFYKTYTSGHATFLWGKDVSPWMNDLFGMLDENDSSVKQIRSE